MLFNSLEFAVYLPVVFAVYWFLVNKNLRLQNLFILVASYVFYGWWDWRFLSLIIFSTLIDYSVGLGLDKYKSDLTRKWLLTASIIVNLGLLGFFKYYNFFLDNFKEAFTFFGGHINTSSLNIILPVGISFYTFQTLSYSIDIYRRKLTATTDFIAFAAFVSFFPQLVAGPIERASNLLPQFYKSRVFDHADATNGLRQILWGLFKKIVIADNCAQYANMIFNHSSEYSGFTLLFGAILFAFQIYGDFSGYSDIAIGTARLFGFNLMRNFAFPYFSRDIAEFWRRWHISLSTFFRDYLYIPLGGSRGGNLMKIRNTFIIFIVSGFWHGANWTFLAWGFLNALYFLPLLLSNTNRNHLGEIAEGRLFPSFRDALSIGITFLLTVFAWIFFRSESLGQAFSYIHRIFTGPWLTWSHVVPAWLIQVILVFLIVEWLGRSNQYAIEKIGMNKLRPVRYVLYYLIVFSIFWFAGSQQQFIYFQF